MTDQPASDDEKWRGGEGGDLEKSETGDSGTCVDEILSPGALGTSKEEEEEERKGEEYEEVFEAEDLVQLTVSSLASLGMLEDVPEHADEDNSDLMDEQATVRCTRWYVLAISINMVNAGNKIKNRSLPQSWFVKQVQGGRSCAGARVAPAEKFGLGRKF